MTLHPVLVHNSTSAPSTLDEMLSRSIRRGEALSWMGRELFIKEDIKGEAQLIT